MDDNHVCTRESCPEGDEYFVSAMDAGKLYYMVGPCATHQEALSKKEEALKIANKLDGRSWFMSWGTVRVPTGSGKVGALTKIGAV